MTVGDPIARLVAPCQGMLAGNVSFIEGSRYISGLGKLSGLDENDPDILVFVGVDSETDHIPFGEVRQQWSELAIDANVKQWREAVEWAKLVSRSAASNLIKRLRHRTSR